MRTKENLLLLPPAKVANLSQLKDRSDSLGSLIKETNFRRKKAGLPLLQPHIIYDRHRPELGLVYTVERKVMYRGQSAAHRAFFVLHDDRQSTIQTLLGIKDQESFQKKAAFTYEKDPGVMGIAAIIQAANKQRLTEGAAPIRRKEWFLEKHPEIKRLFHRASRTYYVWNQDVKQVFDTLTNMVPDREYRDPVAASKYCQETLYPPLAAEFGGIIPDQKTVIVWALEKAQRYFRQKAPRAETEDLAQEALLRLFPYFTGREEIADPSAKCLMGLLYKTCRHLIADREEKLMPEAVALEDKHGIVEGWEDDHLGPQLPQRLIEKAGLKTIEQIVFVLRAIDGLSHDQIVDWLSRQGLGDRTNSYVRSVYFRATRKLRKYLKRLGINGSADLA